MNIDHALSILDPAPATHPPNHRPPERPRPRVMKLLWAAAVRLRNQAVIMTSGVAAFIVVLSGHPWIGLSVGALGTFAYALLVLRDLFDPSLIARVHGIPDSTRRMHELIEATLRHPLDLEVSIAAIEPTCHRDLVHSIASTHESLRAQLRSTDPLVAAALVDTYNKCTELATLAGPLAVRGQTLTSYLESHTDEDLERDIGALDELATETTDSDSQDTFAAAADARRAQLATYLEVCALRDRITARLSMIDASLQWTEARVVKLVASGPDVDAGSFADLSELAHVVCVELGTYESSLDAAREPH